MMVSIGVNPLGQLRELVSDVLLSLKSLKEFIVELSLFVPHDKNYSKLLIITTADQLL